MSIADTLSPWAWLVAFEPDPPSFRAQPRPTAAEAKAKRALALGMVQLGSLTYRVLGLGDHQYGIVRLVDDRFLGTFRDRPSLSVCAEPGENECLLREVATAAIRQGRTAWYPSAKS